MEDSYIHKGLRKKLIEKLVDRGIRDEKVLSAIDNVPRHLFMDKAFLKFAYVDKAFPIGNNQTISQPFTVAFQTQLLEIRKFDKVLEIGTGSGYQTAILSKLARRIYSVERFKPLYEEAREIFRKLQLNNVTSVWGDGSQGIVEQQPFDRIIVTAAAEDPPPTLLNQLKIGGIMVIPVGQSDEIQKLIRVERTEKNFKYEDLCDVRFVPLLEGREEDIYV